MESDSTPEIVINPLGLELTNKIAEMMRHPREDTDPAFFDELEKFHPEVDIEELKSDDRSLLTAYRQPVTGILLHLQMPKPDSPSNNSADKRWQITIEYPFEQVGDNSIRKSTHVEIDETTYDCSVDERENVYRNGVRVHPNKTQFVFDPENPEKVSEASIKIIQEAAAFDRTVTPKYDDFHPRILEILESFEEEDEILEYDPANGAGV